MRDQGNIAILPVNTGSTPIIQARVSLKWDLSSILSTIVWLQYVRDNNATFVERDPNEGTVALRTFVAPDFLGLGASAQARSDPGPPHTRAHADAAMTLFTAIHAKLVR